MTNLHTTVKLSELKKTLVGWLICGLFFLYEPSLDFEQNPRVNRLTEGTTMDRGFYLKATRLVHLQ